MNRHLVNLSTVPGKHKSATATVPEWRWQSDKQAYTCQPGEWAAGGDKDQIKKTIKKCLDHWWVAQKTWNVLKPDIDLHSRGVK